jgi:hypothetical protein
MEGIERYELYARGELSQKIQGAREEFNEFKKKEKSNEFKEINEFNKFKKFK